MGPSHYSMGRACVTVAVLQSTHANCNAIVLLYIWHLDLQPFAASVGNERRKRWIFHPSASSDTETFHHTRLLNQPRRSKCAEISPLSLRFSDYEKHFLFCTVSHCTYKQRAHSRRRSSRDAVSHPWGKRDSRLSRLETNQPSSATPAMGLYCTSFITTPTSKSVHFVEMSMKRKLPAIAKVCFQYDYHEIGTIITTLFPSHNKGSGFSPTPPCNLYC